jgi:hypothetical protein
MVTGLLIIGAITIMSCRIVQINGNKLQRLLVLGVVCIRGYGVKGYKGLWLIFVWINFYRG